MQNKERNTAEWQKRWFRFIKWRANVAAEKEIETKRERERNFQEFKHDKLMRECS